LQSREELILLFKRTVHAAIARNMCTSSLQHLKTKCVPCICVVVNFTPCFFYYKEELIQMPFQVGRPKVSKKSAFPPLPKQQLAIDRGSSCMAAAIGQPKKKSLPSPKEAV